MACESLFLWVYLGINKKNMTIKSLFRGVVLLPFVFWGIILLLIAKLIKIIGLCMLFEYRLVYEELCDLWTIESTLS